MDRYILEQNFEIPIGTMVKIDTLRFSIDLFREQNIILLGIPRSLSKRVLKITNVSLSNVEFKNSNRIQIKSNYRLHTVT